MILIAKHVRESTDGGKIKEKGLLTLEYRDWKGSDARAAALDPRNRP